MSIRWVLRPATAADREATYVFVSRVHVDSSAFSPESRAAQVADLPEDFPELHCAAYDWGPALPEPRAWLAHDCATGALVGAAGLKPCASRGQCVDLSFLFVDGPARRQGLGQALLHAVLQRARTLPGVAFVRLLTLVGHYDVARRMYERAGFIEYSRSMTPAGHYEMVTYELDLAKGVEERAVGAPAAPLPSSVLGRGTVGFSVGC